MRLAVLRNARRFGVVRFFSTAQDTTSSASNFQPINLASHASKHVSCGRVTKHELQQLVGYMNFAFRDIEDYQ